MKETQEELGFDHLPMLSDFVDQMYENWQLYEGATQGKGVKKILDYTRFITQPITEESCATLEGVEIVSDMYKQTKRRFVWLNHRSGRIRVSTRLEYNNGKIEHMDCEDFETIESAINDGIKLKLK